MRHVMMLSAILNVVSTGAGAQTGLTYRFQADTLVGTVWVLGENARRELEAGEGGTAAGRVEIWKDAGKQIFILSDVREVAIAAERFEVPKNYRFREPEIVAPVRKHPRVQLEAERRPGLCELAGSNQMRRRRPLERVAVE